MGMGEEMLEIVDSEGRVIGRASRAEIHGDNRLLHRVVHVIVVNHSGDILLQKRSVNKDVAPGRWDTSVGGHVDAGETVEFALRREMREELGIIGGNTRFMYTYIHTNPYESELVFSYECLHEGPFDFSTEEIEEVRFWPLQEIEETLGKGILSDNFEEEFRRYLGFLSGRRTSGKEPGSI
ncbi:MAG: NUDIX domain-containing protein [Nitrospirae bacterium]|nr:NUDIX domain-containing protein [Nitrospirota bacterium]